MISDSNQACKGGRLSIGSCNHTLHPLVVVGLKLIVESNYPRSCLKMLVHRKRPLKRSQKSAASGFEPDSEIVPRFRSVKWRVMSAQFEKTVAFAHTGKEKTTRLAATACVPRQKENCVGSNRTTPPYIDQVKGSTLA